MKAAVVVFPGSNCDRDALHAVERMGVEAVELWHADADLKGVDAVIVPGGFSYGDYLRAGAIASLAPIMTEVVAGAGRGLPVLGICGGQQLLAVAFGGTLIQHIPDIVEGALQHEQPNPRTEPGHEVSVAPGTLLSRAVGGRERMAVNSAHHQAVDRPGEGAVVNAVAPDGVVEGVEHTGYRFALGVQWHPEYAVDEADPLIFRAFVSACRR